MKKLKKIITKYGLKIFVLGMLILSEEKNMEFLNNVVLGMYVIASIVSFTLIDDQTMDEQIQKFKNKKEILSNDEFIKYAILVTLVLIGYTHFYIAILYTMAMVINSKFYEQLDKEKGQKK